MTVTYLPDLTTELCLTSGVFDFEADDSFDRDDASDTLGVADSLQTWVNGLGTAAMSSNKASFSTLTGGLGLAYLRCLAGGDVQVTVSTFGDFDGVACRVEDASNFWRVRGSTSQGNFRLIVRIDGTDTTIGTYAGAPVNGDVIRVRCEGDEITVYINGVARIGPITDTRLMSAPNAGLYAQSTTARFEDFSASFVWTDISAHVLGVPAGGFGRQHELGQMETATCEVILSNVDADGVIVRRFDPLYVSSPYYPFLKPLRRIRVTATWDSVDTRLFTGHVERWPLDYNRMATDGTVTVTAVDRLAVIGSGLWGVYPDVVSGMLPDAYWRMGAA